jgi:hypothetical protein
MNTQATRGLDGWNCKSYFFQNRKHFILSKNIIQNTDYQILTSNEKVKNYENSIITIVKDQFPTLM